MKEQDFVIRFGRLLHDYSFDIRNQRHLGAFKDLLTKGKATVTCEIQRGQLLFTPVEVMEVTEPNENAVAKLAETSQTTPTKETKAEKAPSIIDASLATKPKPTPKPKK